MTATLQLSARANFDPLAWSKLRIPAMVPAPFAPFHRDLTEWPKPGEKQARVVFRGAAKSTLTKALVVWACQHHRARGVLVLRAVAADSKQDREALLRLAALAGLPAKIDSDRGLILINGIPVWTRTPGGAVRGLQYVTIGGTVIRPDTIIVDDLETRETARSQAQTDKLKTWLAADALQTAGRGSENAARVIMLGTPITPNCLISQAMRREDMFATWLPPLIVPYVNEGGEAAWPSVHQPELEETVPEIVWANEYMLNPLPEGSLYFPPARTWWVPTPKQCRIWVGVDPAVDGEDATGVAAITLRPDVGLHVVDAMAWDGLASQMPLQVAAFIRRLEQNGHTVAGVLFEANKGAWQWPATETKGLVAPITVQTQPPKLSKGERAIPVTLWQQHGWFSMSPHLKGTVADTETHSFTLSEQTITGHDDVFDAIMWAAGVATNGHLRKPPTPRDAQVT